MTGRSTVQLQRCLGLPTVQLACSREHHQVDRPPTVPCAICAPQRGQLPPGRRAAMTSPVCAPPPVASAAASTFRSAR
jgi:hypothetical protein